MSENNHSICRIVSWALVIALISVYAIYDFYSGTLKQRLVAKDAEIAQTARHLTVLEGKLGQATDVEAALRSDITDLQERRQAESKDLQTKLEAATKANDALQAEMAELRTRDAETLATERKKASEAHAELKKRNDAAQKQIADLGKKVEDAKQAQAEAAKRHETELADVRSSYEAQLAEAATQHETSMAEAIKEHEAQAQQEVEKLKERIQFFQTALEGSDPERAQQLASLQQKAKEDRQTREAAEQARQSLESAKAELTQRLAVTSGALEKKTQALTQAEGNLDRLQTKLTQAEAALQALQSKHDEAMDRSGKDLAALQEELRKAQESHANQMDEAEGKIAALTRDLKGVQTALAALQQKHDATVADLRGQLADTEQALSKAKADLSASSQAAAKEKQALEQQVNAAQERISVLEKTIADERRKAEAERLASQRESKKTQAYLRDLYAQISKLGGRQTERGMLLSLADSDLRFATSQADLPAGDLPSLDGIAQLLVQHPELTVHIEGHTDDAGRDETNLELSQKRADAVKQALVDRGVAADRMVAQGIGEARPVADNATPAGRRQNRRVEIYVMDQGNEM